MVVLFTLPLPSAAQTTQTLSLDEGWNLVSLRVQPDDSSFKSIFAGTNGSISSVKNEHGAAYLPDLGIEQISTWRADEGYKVHAETATTLDVTGTALSPGAVAIPLEEGGNIVPYLPDRAQAVEKALMSIDGSLVAVEGEEGRRYPSGSTPLDSLRPGQGYKVYVDWADTLRYPVVVETVDDALALQGLDVGTVVEVQGRKAVGDGGGGLFEVENNECQTDGATCFIFKEDLSAQQEVVTSSRLGAQPGYDLPHTDLAWTEVRVKYGPDADQYLPALQMYGHDLEADDQGGLDTKNGLIGGTETAFYQKRFFGGGDSYDFRIRYKYATSSRRLVRKGVTNAFNIDWWGGTTRVSEGWTQKWAGGTSADMEFAPPDDNTAQIAWALNRAERAVQDNAGINTAYVDHPGMYWRLFGVTQPDNVLMRGIGPDRTVGNVTVRGGHKMPPGIAMWWGLTSGPNSHLGNTSNRWESSRLHKWGIHPGDYPENKIGWHFFEGNGNLSGNQQVWNNYNDYDNAGNLIQNSDAWAFWKGPGSTTTDEGKTGYIQGVRLVADEVAIRRVGGNGLNSTQAQEVPLDTRNGGLYLKDSQRNHLLYGLGGPGVGEPALATDILVEGFAWGAPIKLGEWASYNSNYNTINNLGRRGESRKSGTKYKNVTVKSTNDNTINNFTWNKVFAIEKEYVDFENLVVDIRGGSKDEILVMRNVFWGNKFNTVTLKQNTGGQITLVDFIGDEIRTFIEDERTEFRDVTVEGGGTFLFTQKGKDIVTNLLFKDVTLDASGESYFFGGMKPAQWTRGTVPGATRIEHENLTHSTGSYENISEYTYRNGAGGPHLARDTFVKNSTLNNTGDWSVRIGKQSWSDAMGRDGRVYMSNTTFNIPTSSLQYQDQFHYALSPNATVSRTTNQGDYIVEGGPILRLRNCDTPGGRVSDSVGNTFTSSASDEGNDFVLIPTSLLGRPFEINTTLASSPSGISSITSVEVANADGTLRPDDTQLEHDPYLKVNLDGTIGAGETVAIDWTARVTPLDQYSTTGLFISRPVYDRTSGRDPNASPAQDPDPLQSGNGPWTIDLRGVAATQETWEPPEYTVSSGDTGVVTANVTTTKHRDKQRAYTLELTEQGTGTATITIDASIPDVGTATTTFEVTVE